MSIHLRKETRKGKLKFLLQENFIFSMVNNVNVNVQWATNQNKKPRWSLFGRWSLTWGQNKESFYFESYQPAAILMFKAPTSAKYCFLSYNAYGPASAFFAKSLMKVLYEGWRICASGARKSPTALLQKHNGLACEKFKNICFQIGHMIKYLLTKLGRAGWENIWLSVIVHRPHCVWSVRHDLKPNIFPSGPPT